MKKILIADDNADFATSLQLVLVTWKVLIQKIKMWLNLITLHEILIGSLLTKQPVNNG